MKTRRKGFQRITSQLTIICLWLTTKSMGGYGVLAALEAALPQVFRTAGSHVASNCKLILRRKATHPGTH